MNCWCVRDTPDGGSDFVPNFLSDRTFGTLSHIIYFLSLQKALQLRRPRPGRRGRPTTHVLSPPDSLRLEPDKTHPLR